MTHISGMNLLPDVYLDGIGSVPYSRHKRNSQCGEMFKKKTFVVVIGRTKKFFNYVFITLHLSIRF